jgi:hypothetical protein
MTNPRNRESTTLVPQRPPDVSRRRRELQRLHHCRFIDPAEYRRLLLSRRRLERSDEPRAALRGLRDVGSGRRYLVEDERLK